MAIKPLQSITLKNEDGEDTTYVVASAPAIVETTEPASVASFADGAEGIPVKSLIADINPVQAGSGDPSPSNVRPITGWTGMNVYRKGKNLIDDSIRYANGNQYYIGNEKAHTISLAAGTYTFSVEFLNGAHYAAYYMIEGGTGVPFWVSADAASSATVTLAAGNYMIWIYRSGGVPTADIGHVQLESGSSVSTYEPYNSTTYPISWADEAGTVYGGTLDVTTGLLTVDMAKSVLDQTYTWSVENSGMRMKTSGLASVIKHNGANSTLVGAICDKFEERTPNQTWSGGESGIGFSVAPNGDVAFCQTGAKTMGYSDWITFVTNNPIEVCYELATPQTYQLTPQAVLTILGQNNIWADTGDVEVAYCADTKMYIDKMISEL